MEITLDGINIKSESDLHAILSEKLDFGPYYGNNLAALWDRLTTDVQRPIKLIWKNAVQSEAAIGKDTFAKIVKLLQDVEQQDRDFGRTNGFTFAYDIDGPV